MNNYIFEDEVCSVWKSSHAVNIMKAPVGVIRYNYVSSCLSYLTEGEQQLLLCSEYWWLCSYWDLSGAKYLGCMKEIRYLQELTVYNEFYKMFSKVLLTSDQHV